MRLYHLALTTDASAPLSAAYRMALVKAVVDAGHQIATYRGVLKEAARVHVQDKPWYWSLPGCVMWSDDDALGPGGEDTGLLDRAHAAAYYDVMKNNPEGIQ